MITVDGALGEGGGQIVRTAVTLSALTGASVRIEHIRAGRPKPGLQRQHLAAVRAAAAVTGATVDGATVGSRTLEFHPGRIRAGTYRFDIGSAGSTSLVLQTILPLLMGATGPSSIALQGGTHNPWAPPFEFLAMTLFPLLERTGVRLEARLERHGFYPAGGGRIRVAVTPAERRTPLLLESRRPVEAWDGRVVLARLPAHVAAREVRVLEERLGAWPGRAGVEWLGDADASGSGNAVLVVLPCGEVTEVVSAIGTRGVRAEAVAAAAADDALEYLAADVPVGRHLADQLIVPLAVAAGGRFRTLAPSRHTTTNIAVVRRFVDVPIVVQSAAGPAVQIEVGARPG